MTSLGVLLLERLSTDIAKCFGTNYVLLHNEAAFAFFNLPIRSITVLVLLRARLAPRTLGPL